MSRRLLLINIAGLGRAAVGALTPRLAKLAERRLASEVGHKLMSRLLVDLRTLENSPTVANCRMNREREIRGTNSYAADLGFDAIQFLMERVEGRDSVATRWLVRSAPRFEQYQTGRQQIGQRATWKRIQTPGPRI